MKIKLNREEEIIEVTKVKVIIEDTEFRISVNKFNELEINKWVNDDSNGAIMICPNVSNQITIK